MTYLDRLAMTTVMLALASAPALAQTGTHWVGGETGLAVENTPGTADRAQVRAELAAARQAPGWDQRLREGNYPADTAAPAAEPLSRNAVRQDLLAARENGTNLNPRPQ